MSSPVPSKGGERVSSRGGLAQPVGPAGENQLRQLARRLLRGWDEQAAGWLADKEAAAEALYEVISEVEAIRSPDATPERSRTSAPPLLHYRLAEALRSELTRSWRSVDEDGRPVDPETALTVLSALEEYSSRGGPGRDEGFARRLSEPDAFELIAELAHDMRSPLNSILFLSEVLRSGHSGPVNEQQRSQLGLVYSATLGIVSVVSDVMELASEGGRAQDEEPAPFSIGRVFESVREMVRPMAEEKGLSLEFRLPDYDRCLGFPNRIGRVLLNLTTNALKFTEEGGVTVSARKIRRGQVEFSVSDTGGGIPVEQLDQLFQPFRKSAYRSGHFFSGSGLGLSIARRLVRSMGSELLVQTELGEGSRFFFEVELPASRPL